MVRRARRLALYPRGFVLQEEVQKSKVLDAHGTPEGVSHDATPPPERAFTSR